jgi:hypothetical protein
MGIPSGVSVYVPAATVYIGASLGFGDLYSLWTPSTAQDSYDDLALVRASSENSWSFYAALPSCRGRDGGVVSGGTNDDFLTALSEDEIVVYCGHDNIGFIGLEAEDNLDAEEITQGLQLRGLDVESKLVWLSSCSGASYLGPGMPPSPYDPCSVIHTLGAECAVGWRETMFEPHHRGVTYRAWELMTKRGYSAAQAVQLAVTEAKAAHTPDYVDEHNLNSIWVVGDTTIAPAFTIGGTP